VIGVVTKTGSECSRWYYSIRTPITVAVAAVPALVRVTVLTASGLTNPVTVNSVPVKATTSP